jgi:hypothetical protein
MRSVRIGPVMATTCTLLYAIACVLYMFYVLCCRCCKFRPLLVKKFEFMLARPLFETKVPYLYPNIAPPPDSSFPTAQS